MPPQGCISFYREDHLKFCDTRGYGKNLSIAQWLFLFTFINNKINKKINCYQHLQIKY